MSDEKIIEAYCVNDKFVDEFTFKLAKKVKELEETIEKQKKEIELINQQKIKDWDEINGFSKHNIELKETIEKLKIEDKTLLSLNVELERNIKSKDIEIENLKQQLNTAEGTIVHLKELTK